MGFSQSWSATTLCHLDIYIKIYYYVLIIFTFWTYIIFLINNVLGFFLYWTYASNFYNFVQKNASLNDIFHRIFRICPISLFFWILHFCFFTYVHLLHFFRTLYFFFSHYVHPLHFSRHYTSFLFFTLCPLTSFFQTLNTTLEHQPISALSIHCFCF